MNTTGKEGVRVGRLWIETSAGSLDSKPVTSAGPLNSKPVSRWALGAGTSTRMSFLSLGPCSPTICRQLYLLARRRNSWNRPVCEVLKKPLNLEASQGFVEEELEREKTGQISILILISSPSDHLNCFQT